MSQGTPLRKAPWGRVQWIPVKTGIYFHNNGGGLAVGLVLLGERAEEVEGFGVGHGVAVDDPVFP